MRASDKRYMGSYSLSSIKVRDARAAKDPEPQIPKHRNKKGTKKWCKGKVGRPHKASWVKSERTFASWMHLVCAVCKKELDYCTNWFKKDQCKCGFHK